MFVFNARFKEIKSSPLKRWKMTPTDEKAQELWEKYTTYKKRMFAHTNSTIAPWFIIDANNKPNARLVDLLEATILCSLSSFGIKKRLN